MGAGFPAIGAMPNEYPPALGHFCFVSPVRSGGINDQIAQQWILDFL